MTDNATKAPDKVYYAGIALAAVSFIIYCLPLVLTSIPKDGDMGLFAINYLMAIVYFISIWVTKSWRCMFVFLVLFLISAYSLNRGMQVFEDSTAWLSALLVVYSTALLAVPAIHQLPSWLRQLVGFLLGGALVLFLYLSVYLVALYPVSAILCIALGLSLHSFVPLLIAIFIVIYGRRLIRSSRSYAWSIGAGVLLSVLAATVFTVQWSAVNREVNKSFRKTLIADNTDLPGWIKTAQRLPDTWVTQKYLKGALVYSILDHDYPDFSWDIRNKNFDEGRLHDPLVVFASWIVHQPEITDDERIKILESMYDMRHQTQDRLWTGQNLRTANIMTNMRIWPHQRIAYTEKIITVQNERRNDRMGWWDREEAIYTFHLPEGSVVTSLSLWIDGAEHKAVLTARHKADSAYRQIVGVEQHDPSLVHWQEGNTVSVRVFPVTGGQTRIFKIGVTTPLTSAGGQLAYENIWFQGPDCTGADETQQVDWADEPPGLAMPAGFTRNAPHRYIRDGKYDPDWRLAFAGSGITPASFAFDGQNYMVSSYQKQREAMTLESVYLDINSAWTSSELEDIYNMLKDKKLYVYTDFLSPLTGRELQDTKFMASLMQQRFSLFPFFEIANPATSLVITKSPPNSPALTALKGTDFGAKLEQKMMPGNRVKVFNLGSQLSPYLKTLKEHRAFCYEQGDMALLRQLVTTGRFAASIEDSNHVVIDNAGILLTRSAGTAQAAGPDHLMRLFAYNHIMSQLKSELFSTEADTALVNESEKACIVTPVSSLIVLETQADYDRFNIKKGANTLDDATLKSTGAVPEPHEWALIILAAIGLGWVVVRGRVQQKTGAA